jgi:tetratricopeptide (TPR) repeat protein
MNDKTVTWNPMTATPSTIQLSEPDSLIKDALTASRANDSARAIELFTQASIVAPGSAMPHFLIGSEYAASGEIAKAELAFANAVLLAPQLTIARYQLGLLQFSSGRAALALVTWQALLNLGESDPLPHFIRGFAALAQDAFAEALTNFRAGLSRNNTNPAVSSDIEQIMARIAEVQAASGTVTAPSDSPPDRGTEAERVEEHVLLANYRPSGKGH